MQAHFEYTPLAPNEIDAIHRMVDGQELYVEVVGWGYHPNPQVIAGDKRIQIRFPLEFSKPDIAQPVYYFDLALKLRNGTTLIQDRMAVAGPDGGILYVQSGLLLDLIWDVSIDRIDPNFVRYVRPGVRGTKIKVI